MAPDHGEIKSNVTWLASNVTMCSDSDVLEINTVHGGENVTAITTIMMLQHSVLFYRIIDLHHCGCRFVLECAMTPYYFPTFVDRQCKHI